MEEYGQATQILSANRLSEEDIRSLIPGRQESFYENASKKMVAIPPMTEFFKQGRRVGENRMFLVISGQLNVCMEMHGKVVPFYTLERGEGIVFPMDDEISRFTLMSGSIAGCTLLLIQKSEVEEMLRDHRVAQEVIKAHAKMLEETSRIIPYRREKPSSVLVGVYALIERLVKNRRGLGILARQEMIEAYRKAFSIYPPVTMKMREVYDQILEGCDKNPNLVQPVMDSFIQSYQSLCAHPMVTPKASPATTIYSLMSGMVLLAKAYSQRT